MRRHRPKPRRTDATKPVVRVTTPAQVVASLPVSIGYTPTESLVVVCCHEPRGRTGLTMRVDLPAAERETAVVEQVDAIVRRQNATRVILVVYTDEPDGTVLARRELMDQLLDAFADLVVTEALLVRQGRFWSYVCDRAACCPPGGRPVDEAADSAAVQVLKLELLRAGESQLGSREELEATIAAPVFLAAEEAMQRLETAALAHAASIRTLGLPEARAEVITRWRAALEQAADPRWQLPHDEAARLSISLHDRLVRDTVAAMWEADDRRLRRLLEAVARRTPPPYDAPVCTTLAWVTYCDGAGSITGIALERALRTEPDYQMALLIRHALDNALEPEFVRDITRRTKEVLEEAA
jgi:hypothetical protein